MVDSTVAAVALEAAVAASMAEAPAALVVVSAAEVAVDSAGGGFGGDFGGGGDLGHGGFGGAGGAGGGEFGGLGGGGDLGRGGAGEFGGGGFGAGGAGEFGGAGRDGFGAGGAGGEFGRDGFGGAGAGGFGAGGLDGRAGAGGIGAGAYGAAPSRGQLNSFLGLPSDEGMHNMINNPYVHSGGGNLGGDNFNVQHGSIDGPRGGEAAGTVVEGPRGNTAERGAAVGPNGGVVAGRGVEGAGGASVKQGIAAGPNGRVAGGSVARGPNGGVAARGIAAGPNGWAAGFARVSPSDRHVTAGYARGNYNHWNYFGPGWYTNHPGAWFAAGWAAGRIWYPCTWPAMYGWCDLPEYPIYYDYGNTVVYQDDGVYVNGVDQGTPQEYYDQAQTLAADGAQADASSDGADWMPLGVFLLTKNGEKDSHDVFQLAINKQGIIRGNFQDSADGKTELVQGSANLKTQRVAFSVADKPTTVIETGLYNLTKDEAPALVHIGADQTEQWLLVRLKNPDATPDASSAGGETNTGAAAPAPVPVDESF